MKIALVHDYLNEAGGAERVLRVLSEMYPQAPIYTAFVKRGTARQLFSDRVIIESSWGWLLKIGRLYSYLRFLLPWIWRSIDLADYDLVITSTSGGYIARGFRVGPKTRVVAYCHTPPKWLYGYETPTGAKGRWWGRLFLIIFGPMLRYFDYTSAERVNIWIANSQEVAGRIRKFYRREASVVYPPVSIANHKFPACAGRSNSQIKGDYYLLVTRVTGAKGVMEAVGAAQQGQFKLKLVGEIVETRLRERVVQAGRYIEYMGRVDDHELYELYARARGFVALARDEDFGMTVVEAMQCGTPVLALNSGGYKETVVSGKTGILIQDTSVETVIAGIKRMEKTKWDAQAIKNWASRYSRERFEKEINARITRG